MKTTFGGAPVAAKAATGENESKARRTANFVQENLPDFASQTLSILTGSLC
jgi:hypothetical protein